MPADAARSSRRSRSAVFFRRRQRRRGRRNRSDVAPPLNSFAGVVPEKRAAACRGAASPTTRRCRRSGGDLVKVQMTVKDLMARDCAASSTTPGRSMWDGAPGPVYGRPGRARRSRWTLTVGWCDLDSIDFHAARIAPSVVFKDVVRRLDHVPPRPASSQAFHLRLRYQARARPTPRTACTATMIQPKQALPKVEDEYVLVGSGSGTQRRRHPPSLLRPTLPRPARCCPTG